MSTVTSKDGTTIAYDQYGSGDLVIFVDGATQSRYPDSGMEKIGKLLAPHFTVVHHDRRGRGQSTDTKPFAVQREIEDIEALLNAVGGGSGYLFGISSGGALSFEAALALGSSKVKKLAMYEPPYNDDPTARQTWIKYRKDISEAITADRRGDAIAAFMTLVGVPADQIAGMRHAPFWAGLEAIAPTLAYDAAALGDESTIPPAERASKLTIPVLLMDGGASYPFMRTATVALANAIPNGQQRTLPDQTHDVSPAVIAPALIEFFSAK